MFVWFSFVEIRNHLCPSGQVLRSSLVNKLGRYPSQQSKYYVKFIFSLLMFNEGVICSQAPSRAALAFKNGAQLLHRPIHLVDFLADVSKVACRTSVIFCVFQSKNGKREASVKYESRPFACKTLKIMPVLQAMS